MENQIWPTEVLLCKLFCNNKAYENYIGFCTYVHFMFFIPASLENLTSKPGYEKLIICCHPF